VTVRRRQERVGRFTATCSGAVDLAGNKQKGAGLRQPHRRLRPARVHRPDRRRNCRHPVPTFAPAVSVVLARCRTDAADRMATEGFLGRVQPQRTVTTEMPGPRSETRTSRAVRQGLPTERSGAARVSAAKRGHRLHRAPTVPHGDRAMYPCRP